MLELIQNQFSDGHIQAFIDDLLVQAEDMQKLRIMVESLCEHIGG